MDKEKHYVIKELIQQEMTIENVYMSNARAPSYLKWLLMGLKGDVDSNTTIMRLLTPYFINGQFNWTENQFRTTKLIYTMDQMNLMDISEHFIHSCGI